MIKDPSKQEKIIRPRHYYFKPSFIVGSGNRLKEILQLLVVVFRFENETAIFFI